MKITNVKAVRLEAPESCLEVFVDFESVGELADLFTRAEQATDWVVCYSQHFVHFTFKVKSASEVGEILARFN